MFKLTKRLETLLFMACKQAGSYDPDETLHYIEEQLNGDEYKSAQAFLEWVNADTSNRKFGSANIKERFKEFVNCTKV